MREIEVMASLAAILRHVTQWAKRPHGGKVHTVHKSALFIVITSKNELPQPVADDVGQVKV